MCEIKTRKTSLCEDIIEAMCLPSEVRDSNPEMSYLIGLNRQKYEKVLSDMRADIEMLCSSIDKEAQSVMDLAVEELEMFNTNTNVVDLQGVYQRTLMLKNTQIEAIIDEYCEDLHSLETKRREEVMNILVKYQDLIVNTIIIDQNTLKEVYQSEIDRMNERTTSHLQSIEDFKLKLRVKGQNIYDTLKQILKTNATLIAEKEANLLLKNLELVNNKRVIEQCVLGLMHQNRTAQEDIVEETNRLLRSVTDVEGGCKFSICDRQNDELWKYWVNSLDTRFELLGEECTDLIGLLRTAIGTLMNGLDSEVNKMNTQLLKQIQTVQAHSTYTNTLPDVNIVDQNQANNVRSNVNVVVDMLDNKIGHVRTFIHDLTSIWTEYVGQVKNMLNQLDTDCEDFSDKWLTLTKDTNLKIKIQTKKVREANDIKKLNSSVDKILKMVDSADEKLSSEFKSEVNILLDIKNEQITKIIEHTLSNIRTFFQLKQQTSYLVTQGEFNSSNVNVSESETPIDKCEMYLNVVANKMVRMCDVLEGISNELEIKVVQKCDDWYREFVQDIVSKYSNDLADFIQSQRKVIQDVKQIRSGELTYHSDRLLSHNQAARETVSRLDRDFQHVKVKIQSLFEEFNEHKVRLVADHPTDSSKQIEHLISELESKWSDLKEKMESCVSETKHDCRKWLDNIDHSNHLFAKTAKLFKNGGNYSPAEMKSLSKELKQIEKECRTQRKMLLNNYNDLLCDILKYSLDKETSQLKLKLHKVTREEMLVEEISTLMCILRAEIRHMKESGRKIYGMINNLATLSNVDEQLVNEIILMINSRFDYLSFPSELITFEPLMVNLDHIDSSDSKRSRLKAGKPTKRPKPKISQLFTNVSKELFCSTSNNYFTRTKGILMRKFDYLIRHVCDETKDTSSESTNKTLKKGSTKPETLTEYVNAIKSMFLAYNKECEFAWNCEAKIFIEQMITLRKYIDWLNVCELKNYHRRHVNKLGCLQEELECLTETDQSKGTADRENISQALVLPLAHPTHRSKLSDLLEKATTLCRTQNENVDEIVQEYKEHLQNTHDQYVESIQTLKDKLTNKQTLVTNHISSKMEVFINQVESVSHLVQENIPELDNIKQYNFPTSIWLTVDDCDPSTYLSNHVVADCDPSTYLSNHVVADCDPSTYLSNHVVADCLLVNITTRLIKESAESIQKYFDEAKMFKMKNEKCVSNWLKKFKCSVEQCKLVYKPPCK